MKAHWSTPADLLQQLTRLWERGELLRGAESLYPLRLRLRRPTSRELGEHFGEVRDWIRALEHGSDQYGYLLEYEEINHRQLGRNRVPSGVFVPTEVQALRILGKTRAAERYSRLVDEIRREFPPLEGWLFRKALLVLELVDSWPKILSVLRWFRSNPSPGLYRRQLEIEGVDTKFIEGHQKVLSELLALLLPPEHVADEPGLSFDRRFGLKEKPPLIRFRLLDASQAISGLTDLTVPAHELARLELPVDEVIVTENEVNGLALPARRRTLVLFGQGYAVERLVDIRWLGTRRLRYWGDIDTHGFTMLDRFRAHFPWAESMLMDVATLLGHRPMWVTESSQRTDTLSRLSTAESALYGELVRGVHGDRIRLEQERIGFAWVRQALDSMG